MIFFSIIIPTYNSEASIKRCIASVLEQSHANFEIIIQDGISRDNTIKIIDEFNDARIKIFSEPDKGIYDAMNKAVNKSKGHWLYFLGSDDYLYDKNVLENIARFSQQSSASLIYGNVKLIGDASWAKHGEIYKGETPVYELMDHNICHQSIFYKSEIFNCGIRYNLSYPYCADHDFNLICASKFEMKYFDTIVSNFSGGGISSIKSDQQFGKDKWQNVIKYFDIRQFTKEFLRHKSHIRRSIKTFSKRGEYKLAVKAFLVYIRLKINFY